MAPNPQEVVPKVTEEIVFRKPSSDLNGDEVVISGMSGIFPSSENVGEFMYNLYNNVDMVTINNEPWTLNHPKMPKYLGKVNGFQKFDGQFFGVPHGQSECLDAMTKKTMENAYAALFDAGVNPKSVAGTKLGVFAGSSSTDGISVYDDSEKITGYMMTGTSKSMMANRISYWLDVKGPSYALDATCSSSIAALDHAYHAMRKGICDSAIVTGSNLCRHPKLFMNLRQAGFLCLDGKTKCFDKNADGYVRSEAVGVLYLQKASNAKRIYAQVVHTKGKYFTKPDSHFLPLREPSDLEHFLNDFYSEIDITPNDVEYLEAFCAGLRTADENELEAISKVFAEAGTIKIGCVKSNMGHCNGASDLCGLIKMCLAYHRGQLPGNLHYNEPKDHISAVYDGRIQVVTETTPFKRGYSAINSLSSSGANYHALIKGHYKIKNLDRYYSPLPRLVLASGRTNDNVSKILNSLKSHPIDAEQLALLHDFFASGISGHTARGYVILDTNENNETISLSESVSHYSGTKAPVWFLYSGMGSQWPGMGAELMQIPTFAASIERCRKVLEPKGVDLVKILTYQEENMFDCILNSFVGIAAVQIGLTDVLKEIGIEPDYVIGHSLGELGCAYADGSFTAEEMILVSYCRGKVSKDTKFIDGLMAAVGLGHEDVSLICPPEIEVACHNSPESSTISGPADEVRKFIKVLNSRGIFAKEVQTANIAYHSRYIADAAPQFLSTVEQIIKKPKLRSNKWICTSAPPDKWDHPDTRYASSKYFLNNFRSNVYFEEAASRIPNDAIVIEIAPHGLMQAIMKKSHRSCTHIPLTRRGHEKPVQFLLEAVGKLFQTGLNPIIYSLYPKMEYPVSTETPLLSPLAEWAHSEDWPIAGYKKYELTKKPSRKFAMEINDEDWRYLKGHVRNGTVIFPETAYLVLVWETLAMYKGLNFRDMSVVFEDIRFEKELHIENKKIIRFTIELQMGCCRFEIADEESPIVSGFIKHVKNIDQNKVTEENFKELENVVLTAKDIYMLFAVKGFSYTGAFQSVLSYGTSCNTTNVKWTNEWVTYLDSLIQLTTLTRNKDGISRPKFIKCLTIDTILHKTLTSDEVTSLNAYYDKTLDVTRSGGVQIFSITFIDKPVLETHSHILEKKIFIPHISASKIDIETALKVNLQIITENITEKNFKVIEVIQKSNIKNKITYIVKRLLDVMAFYNAEVNCYEIDTEIIDGSIFKDRDFKTTLFIFHHVMDNNELLTDILHHLSNSGFILLIEHNGFDINLTEGTSLKIITSMSVGNYKMILLRRVENKICDVSYIKVKRNDKFSWIPNVKRKLDNQDKFILVSERENNCGLIGIVKALKRTGYNNIGVIVVMDDAPKFNPQLPFYKKQIEKNLTFNIFDKEHWGDYYYLPILESSFSQNIKLTNNSGNIDGSTWEDNSVNTTSENVIQVQYAGISLHDCEKTINVETDDNTTYGMDFSGYNKRGEKVMGLVESGAVSSIVSSDPTLLWLIPNHWSMQDASTVPLPYVHAYYCTAVQNQLQGYDTVLVLGGAGALGQAIISICLDLNCTVLTTVSNEEKKQALLQIFPKLKEEHIILSEYHNVHSVVTDQTKKKMCDYVFNCVSGDLREHAMKCVGLFGTFVDISQYDKKEDKKFGLGYLLGGRNYKSLNLSSIFKTENLEEKKLLHSLLSNGIDRGVVKPLPKVIYTATEVSKAFSFVTSRKRIGRVLVNLCNTLNNNFEVKARIDFSPDASYIVICDENYLGIELASWVVKRGVRKVILHLKNISTRTYLNAKRETWKNLGVLSAVSTENLQTNTGCSNLLSECEKVGAVQGIFIVRNSVPETQSDISIHETFTDERDNITMVSNLDKLSRKICRNVRHFVIISPITKNLSEEFVVSEIENICDDRNKNQYPALVIHFNLLKEIHKDSNIPNSETFIALFNSMEKSLKFKYNNVVITRSYKQDININFMDKLSKIIGVSDFETIKENKTLNSLTLNETCLDEIRNLLNKTFKIDYSAEELKRITIGSLKELFKNAQVKMPTAKGIRAFYNYIESDEMFAVEPIVIMPSKIGDCIHKLPEELYTEDPHLIMVPGFEGHSRIFSCIGERLKIQAASLQLSPDTEGDTIPQIAEHLLKHIKDTFVFGSQFYILGYSFGVNIALELAAMLEKEGHLGVIYCLDSSPDAVKAYLDAFLGKLPDSELQNTFITEMYNLMTGKINNLDEELNNFDDWTSKVTHCLKKMKNVVTLSYEYQQAIFNSTYQRIVLAKAYEPCFKLKSKLVLIKSKSHSQTESLSEDYNLTKYTTKPVNIFYIESDHQSAPYDCEVSNIVNIMLEPKLLEKYRNQNLCEIHSNAPVRFQGSKISALRVPSTKKHPNLNIL